MAKAIYGDPPPKVSVREISTNDIYLPKMAEGEWFVRTIEQERIDITGSRIPFGSPTPEYIKGDVTMVLTLVERRTVEAEEHDRVAYALRDQPPKIQEAIEALFQIEHAMPDREAVIEVEPGDDGPKFTVTTRPRANR